MLQHFTKKKLIVGEKGLFVAAGWASGLVSHDLLLAAFARIAINMTRIAIFATLFYDMR